jgi:hypothetical protein
MSNQKRCHATALSRAHPQSTRVERPRPAHACLLARRSWLYEQVPWSDLTWTEEETDGKTVMYWHPTYVKLFQRRIRAIARFLRTKEARGIAYFRSSWDAVGEERIFGENANGSKVFTLQDGSNWKVPDGCKTECDPPPSWKGNATDDAYKRDTARVWREAFNRSLLSKEEAKAMPILLLRSDEVHGAYSSLSAAQMGRDGFGWYHTGAAMEETQCFNQLYRYEPFLRDCLPGKVVCFTEACGLQNFAGPGGNKRTPELEAANFSRLQGIYWMMLSGMSKGVSVTGLHSKTMLKPWLKQESFKKAFSWADGYMGLHASPELTPGAWVAFRGVGDHHKPYGDYSFLMSRIESDTSVGLQQCGDGDEDEVPYGAWCRELPAHSGMYFALDPNNRVTFNGHAILRLVYQAPAELELYCDDGTADGKLALSTSDSSDSELMWNDVRATVAGSKLMRGGGKKGSDLWLLNQGSRPARVHLIEARHPQGKAVDGTDDGIRLAKRSFWSLQPMSHEV